jgi:hypothetical protein
LRVDDAIEAALLQVVQPGAIEAAIAAEADSAAQRDQVREALLLDLEAARYATDRAFRQYDAADPTNRLVAAELETRWNQALMRVAEVEEKIAKHDAATMPRLEATPLSLGALADNLRAVWSAPTSDARLKKRIVRTVIREVIADIDADAGMIVLLIHWMGGTQGTASSPPAARPAQQHRTRHRRRRSALVLIANDDLIAGLLNRNRLMTGNGNRWTRERVTSLRSHHKIPVHRPADDGIESMA